MYVLFVYIYIFINSCHISCVQRCQNHAKMDQIAQHIAEYARMYQVEKHCPDHA